MNVFSVRVCKDAANIEAASGVLGDMFLTSNLHSARVFDVVLFPEIEEPGVTKQISSGISYIRVPKKYTA